MYRNPKDIKRQVEYKADEAAGNCLSKYGVWCGCIECEKHDKAYGVIDGKPPNVTAFDSLVENGFSETEAMQYVFDFDDLGIFTGHELFSFCFDAS